MKRQTDKNVLITGGARGIGLSTAEAFAKAGATVVISDVDAASLKRATAQLKKHGGRVLSFVCDVAKQKEVETVVARAIRQAGGLDILINNAGVGCHAELAHTSLRTWKKLMAVNFWGPLYHVYAVLPHFKERGGGQIVNVSSAQAFLRLPTWGAYAAIKSALAVFSEVLHAEVRKHGVRVTTVYPYMVNTGFYDGIDGDTWVGRMAMKLVPLYSMSAERVGQIVFRAALRGRRIEMVTPINDLIFYTQMVPVLPRVIARVANFALSTPAP